MGRTSILGLSFIFFILFIIITINGQTYQKYCNEAQQCANAQFGTNYTTIYCRGFQSCMNLKYTVVSVNAQCHGAQSCMNIVEPYLQVGKLECHGYESCLSSKIYTDGNMECYGEKSCYKTSIDIYKNLNDNDNVAINTIDCNGALSCAKSKFNNNVKSNTTTVSFDAHDSFALYNTTINSTNGPLTLDLGGYYSGWNLTVICGKRKDYTCSINCYGTGCYNSKILCINDNYCNIRCNNSNGDLCPLNITYNDDDTAVNHENSIMTGNYNVDYTYNHNVSVDFINVELTNNENYCVNSTLSDAYFDYCDNFRECYNGTYIDNNNKSICCHGYQSCEYSILRTSTTTFLNSQNKIDALVRCDGELGCEATTIVANNTINCGGYHSCQNAGLDTAGKISCNARQTCLSASIADANELSCNSYYSCYSSNIQRVNKVYGFGYRAFGQATIRSSDTMNMTLNVYMCAYHAGYGAQLCCYAGDICNVYCSSEGSCDSMNLSDDDGCDGGTVNIHWNSSVAQQECQVYLKQETPTTTNVSMNYTMNYTSTSGFMFNESINGTYLSMTSTSTIKPSTTMKMTGNYSGNYTNPDMSTSTAGNDHTGFYYSSTESGGGGGSSGANDNNKTIEIVLIVVVTLIVIAVSVGLVLYFMKNRNMKRGASQDEQRYKLLDKQQL